MTGKHRALLMLAIVSFALPMGEIIIFKHQVDTFNTYVLAEALLTAYAIYWWYVLDRRERNFSAGTLQNIAVLGLTLIGLPIYFIRSRGWGRGTVASLGALGIFICIVVLTWLGQQAGSAIAVHR